MSGRPPGDLQDPDAEELRALDAFIDALATVDTQVSALLDPGLTSLVHRLDRAPESVWESAAPLFQAPAPVLTPGRDADPPRQPTRRIGQRIRRPSFAEAWVAAAAAVLVVLVVIGINAFSGQPSPRPVTGVAAVPTAWRLTGFIDQSAWMQVPSTGSVASSVTVTCPDAVTCYADDLGSSQSNAVVERTTDGGAHWQPSNLPTGTVLSSGLTCPSARQCLVAGFAGGSTGSGSPARGTPSIFVTTDGGATWSASAVPSVAEVVTLDCATTTVCVGVGYGSSTSTNAQGPPLAVHSMDGGASWSVVPLAGPFAASFSGGLSCATSGQCVVVGTTGAAAAPDGSSTGHGAAFYSADGGATWSPSSVPSGVAILRAVSCSDATHCVAMGNGPSTPAPGTTTVFPYGFSEALASTDGGRSWHLTGSAGLAPSDLSALSCPTATDCWAVGAARTAAGTEIRAGMIVVTHDGGATWTTDELPTTLTIAQQQATGFSELNIQDVSSVSCPVGGRCVAMAAQGSSNSPTQGHLVLSN